MDTMIWPHATGIRPMGEVGSRQSAGKAPAKALARTGAEWRR